MVNILTADKWDAGKLVPPLLSDLDRFLLHGFIFSGHSLVVGMLDEISHVVGLESIQQVEKVSAIRPSTVFSRVRQVHHHLLVAEKHGIEFLD